jgi:hypothetical protein
MMWILPKSLISAFAQDTEVLTLDSGECSQTCAQSLMRRSKPSQSSAYLREWKAGNLMRLRSGAISSPSLGKAFEAWWTSSLEVTHVSHSAQQDNVEEQKIQDISGRLSQPELLQCDQLSVSLKTSRDISHWGCPTSSKTWQEWVTERRGEYSARLNAVRHTNENVCSSWPTVTANEDSYRIGGDSQASKCFSAMARRGEMSGLAAQGNHSTHGSRLESWATPRTMTGGTCKNGAQHCDLNSQAGGKLNPRWVETLMGLPVGWTMPSCVSPVIPV